MLLVEQHELHNGGVFNYTRSHTGDGLRYVGGGGRLRVPNDDLDFEQLQNEGMIIFRPVAPNEWRGKPTPLGIATAEKLKQSTAAPLTTAAPDSAAEAHEVPEPRPDLPTVDPERLIAEKDRVGVPAAARYLDRTEDHVLRLLREKKLEQLGQGKPKQVSTASLRKYKGT